ncbi:helicase ARIP4 isoform X2 [Tetranychus urticae]|uniref:helicase ARIP4 isoform X2 n=1 Tax=Tetranychus urticae TaxID=32264 RepID=UPI00077BC093|nr:helicase ARIP4 isoform X2 [Tetranychus urticae]
MDFTPELTDVKLPGPTDLFNGTNPKDTNNRDFSSHLSSLERILEEATQCLSPSVSRTNPKSKSNPLLDQLLDKPLDDGDLRVFGSSGGYSDNCGIEPGTEFNSNGNECSPSLFDLPIESPLPFGDKSRSNISEDEIVTDCEDDDEDQEDHEDTEDNDDDSNSDDEDKESEDEENSDEDDKEESKNENGRFKDDKNVNDSELNEISMKSIDVDNNQLADSTKNNKRSEAVRKSSNRLNKGRIKESGTSNTADKLKGKGLKRKGKTSKDGKKAKRYMMRKNIKKIISDGDVNEITLKAQQEEAERLRRVEERAALMKQQNQKYLLQNSQDDVMVLSSDDELIAPCNSGYDFKNDSDADIIEIASDDEFSGDDDQLSSNNRIKKERKRRSAGDVEFIDTNNDGAHTDDRFNQPDEQGRVLVNVGHNKNEEPIYLAPQLSRAVKPHQIGGIRFLYDNIVECLRKHKTSEGLGCILAHSMGLGKTLQLISFIDVYLTHTQSKYVLCIVPINTLQNWMSEFDMWLPSQKVAAFRPNSSEMKFRQFDVFMLNDCKTLSSRAKEILAWRKSGGVLLIGYEMYRLLTTDGKTAKGKKVKTKETEGLPKETYDHLMSELKAALVDPGPDLVVCDEGHRLKDAATSQALKNIRTRRRIVLTHHPLQNNLIEYWCMVDFVRPNFLGTKQEFCNMFERPISNGQCADSTPEDKRVMKQRAHVLHKLLRGFVQRRSHSILTKSLPRKHEHVILVRMTPIQKKLMLAFLDRIKKDLANSHRLNPIMLFSVFCKIWNHPDILFKIVKEGQNFDDLDIDLGEKTKGDKKAGKKKGSNDKSSNAKNGKRGKKSTTVTLSDIEDEDLFVPKKDLNQTRNLNSNNAPNNSFDQNGNGYSVSFSNGQQLDDNVNHGNNFDSYLASNSSYNHQASSYHNPSNHPNSTNSKPSNQPILDLEDDVYNLNRPSSSTRQPTHSNIQYNWNLAPNNPTVNPFAEYKNIIDVPTPSTTTNPPFATPGSYPNRMMDYTWAEPIVANYKPGLLQNGLKMLLFFEIVEQTIKKGDRLLVFSHSLFTLDIIEKFLSQRNVPKAENQTGSRTEKWSKGNNYFRIDGSTSANEREKLINSFNKNSSVHLFLLSTRAGCLGINLIGANRIIVFDASWNPCHDAQAACRIYRYGQQKECFIYRLICDESLEKRIYDRQITKQEVSHRVVDELNPETNFTKREIDSLIEDLDDINLSEVKSYSKEECDAYEDDIISYICKNMNQCLSKPPFEHESLLLDHKESKLSQYEKKLAEAIYFRQKQAMTQSAGPAPKNPMIANPNFLANVPTVPTIPGKPALGRPSLYPSVGIVPPPVRSRMHTPFNAHGWNNYPTGHPNFNLPNSSNNSFNQPRVPNILSRNSIINQYNNLPPGAFVEQLSRMGYLVKAFINPRDFIIPASASNREVVKITKGMEIFMIRSPQNEVYLRTHEGRMFSLKIDEAKCSALFGSQSMPPESTPLLSNMISQSQNHASPSSSLSMPSTSSSQPELICLDDDD